MHLAPAMQAILAQEGTLVAANARAARSLRVAYGEAQRAGGLLVWPTPPIHDWESWLGLLWQDAVVQAATMPTPRPLPMLLSPLQERALWRRVIERQGDAAQLLTPDGMAALAQSAYALLSHYERHGVRNSVWSVQSDAESFRGWAAQFDRECARHAWTSHSSVERLLTESAQAAALSLPPALMLIGFDRVTPAQERLLRVCSERGVRIERDAAQPDPSATHRLIRADDVRDEILTFALWARDLLTHQPGMRIGVLASDVSAIRGDLERTFLRVLVPGSTSITAPATAPLFEFSLGRPLSSVPLVRAALLLLRWLDSPLIEEEVTWLGLSGFLSASNAEYLGLADFDSRRRNSGALSPEITLSAFLAASDTRSAPSAREFRARLREVQRTAHASDLSTRERSHSDWVAIASLLLQQAAWPGSRALLSEEFQALQKWEQALDEIASLDFDGGRVSYRDFFSALTRRASEIIFAPQSHDAPIQISGVFEASGQMFDAVWLLGADDEQWPASARAHPLLPIAVQREAEMPHSSSTVDWELALAATRRIRDSASQCVFSYARQNAYGDLRPSPVLREVFATDIATISAAALRASFNVLPEAPRMAGLDTVDDDSGVLAWNATLSAGGSDVLKMQAACPFQAFASKRLHAEPLNRTEWGLNAAERGNLIHNVLERLWSPLTPEEWSLRTLDDLRRARDEGRIDLLLKHHAGQAFESLLTAHSGDSWMQTYLTQEQERLCVRLREWLDCESVRQPFTVEHVEQRLDAVSVGGLQLRLRADRVDMLPDGSRLILDYKTGVVSAAKWSGPRPDEPQLPLYATYGGLDQIRGILFAQIRAGETKFIGRVEDARTTLNASLKNTSSLIKDPYTPALRDEWDAALRDLAAQFLAGDAAVDPKHGNLTCKYCPLPGLCRVAETVVVSDTDEDADCASTENGEAPSA